MLPAGGDQAGPAGQAAQRATRKMVQFRRPGGAEVGQFVLLPVGPYILDRVEFRGIGGQVFLLNPAVEAAQILLHPGATMDGQPVPDQQQGDTESAAPDGRGRRSSGPDRWP